MPYKKYNWANNAFATLAFPIADDDLTLVLAGKFGRMPTSNFIMKVTHTEGGVVTGREEIYVETRSGATCTGLIRAYEAVPTDDDATTNIQQALNFDAGDLCEVVISAEIIKDIQEEVDAKLAKAGWLRTGFWVNKTVYVEPATGNEVLKNSTSSAIIPDANIISSRDETTGHEIRTPFSDMKTALSTAGKYLQSYPLGEAPGTGCIVWMVPICTGAGNTLGYTPSDYKAFDNDTATFAGITGGGTAEIKVTLDTNDTYSNFSVYFSTWSPSSTFTIQGSMNDSTYTTLYTSAWIPAANSQYNWVLANQASYKYYKIVVTKTNDGVATYRSLQFYKQTTGKIPVAIVTGAVQMINTMWSNIAGARVKSGIRFSVPYATTLGIVKTSQVSSNALARVQLFADDWTTLIAEQTPATSDTVTFPNTALTANTIYRLVMNDSQYFWNNNNELALASYQANMQFCISWTLNWSSAVEPQNIKQVEIWTMKAMKAGANLTAPYAIVAGYVSPSNKVWDLLSLDVTDFSPVLSMTELKTSAKYYLWDVTWSISTTWSLISRVVWYTIDKTTILIQYSWTNLPWTSLIR